MVEKALENLKESPKMPEKGLKKCPKKILKQEVQEPPPERILRKVLKSKVQEPPPEKIPKKPPGTDQEKSRKMVLEKVTEVFLETATEENQLVSAFLQRPLID